MTPVCRVPLIGSGRKSTMTLISRLASGVLLAAALAAPAVGRDAPRSFGGVPFESIPRRASSPTPMTR